MRVPGYFDIFSFKNMRLGSKPTLVNKFYKSIPVGNVEKGNVLLIINFPDLYACNISSGKS